MGRTKLPTLNGQGTGHPTLLAETLLSALDPNDTTPIVSVGSGNGAIEHFLASGLGLNLSDKKADSRIVCIDPEPESYVPYLPNMGCLPPDYPTVRDALQKRDLKGCILLLIWPEPTKLKTQPLDYLPYDVEALLLLQPKKVFLFYCATGTAGSDLLHNWLDPNIPDNRTDGNDIAAVPRTSKYLTLGVSPIIGAEWRETSAATRAKVESLDLPKYRHATQLFSAQNGTGYTAEHRVLLELY